MNTEQVQGWLDGYVEGWRRNDREQIAALFTEDAVYYTDPFREPYRGQGAILRYWEESGDVPDAFDAHYEPLFAAGDHAVAHGYSRYFTQDRKSVDKEYRNVFVLRFDGDGRCAEYREWYMLRRDPPSAGA